jgi:hypothetical protein
METIWTWIGQALDWATRSHIGDASGLIGLIITIFGFYFAIRNSVRAKDAAIGARKAADGALNSINLYNDIVDMSTIIVSIEEIAKKIHDGDPAIIDRLFDVRKRLIMINRENGNIGEQNKALIKNTIVVLADFSNSLTSAKHSGEDMNFAKINKKILAELETLIQIFSDVRRLQMEGR